MPRPAPFPKSRLEALTDGIFAVTMTLLVLDLKIPDSGLAPGSTLFDALPLIAGHVDNYVISFVVLAVFWVSHVRMLGRMREADSRFTALNLAFLLFTTLVPPLTSVLGDHPAMPRAAVLYGANLLLILLFETLAWRRASLVLANGTVADGAALWTEVRNRNFIAMGVVVAGIAIALVEIRLGVSRGLAPWTYLLLIGAGVMRPAMRGTRRQRP